MMRGSRASSRSLTRSRLTCTSIERSSGAVAPHREIHELVAVEHAVGMLDEHSEQPELSPAQRTTTPSGATSCRAAGSSVHPAKRTRRVVAARGRQAARAPQDGLDARQSSRGLNGFAR